MAGDGGSECGFGAVTPSFMSYFKGFQGFLERGDSGCH